MTFHPRSSHNRCIVAIHRRERDERSTQDGTRRGQSAAGEPSEIRAEGSTRRSTFEATSGVSATRLEEERGPEERLEEKARPERSEALGVVPVALLALLQDGPRHGYELRTLLGEVLSCEARSSAVSFGSLYPALARLESEGLIECDSHSAPLPIPATGSLTGELAAVRAGEEHRWSWTASTPATKHARNRRVYRLTPLGAARLDGALSDSSAAHDDRAFTLRLALGDRLGPLQRRDLLEVRVQALEEKLRRLGGGRSVGNGWRGAGRDRAVALVRAELSWLSELRHGRREGD